MNETINQKESYLTFRINKGLFASKVANIFKIIEIQDITDVPNTPEYILGIIQLDNKTVPVIDSGILFRSCKTESTNQTSILLLDIHYNGKKTIIGFVVERVHEVIEIDASQILPVPELDDFSKVNEFLTGTTKPFDESILLLDFVKLFNTKELMRISSDFKNLLKTTSVES